MDGRADDMLGCYGAWYCFLHLVSISDDVTRQKGFRAHVETRSPQHLQRTEAAERLERVDSLEELHLLNEFSSSTWQAFNHTLGPLVLDPTILVAFPTQLALKLRRDLNASSPAVDGQLPCGDAIKQERASTS